MESSMQSLAHEIHDIAVDNGFWEDYIDANFVLAKLALINSEVAEILEAYRKEQGAEAIAVEFADTIIRVLDLWVGLQEAGVIPAGLDLSSIIKMKNDINKSRPRKHGNLI
jgi:NTP pyrophosphatase (non-canonical NTP hydrolase)